LQTENGQHTSDSNATGIRIKNLCVRYGSQRILDCLDLDVTPGEIVALLGASGCGKSTLLRAIAKLLPIETGAIEFSKPNRRTGDLAFVFQDATLLPWRTVEENVRLPLELGSAGRKADTSAISEALAAVGLPPADFRKFPRELSGGMRMRTSIARALVTNPSVMLLDEPFAALDDILRTRLNELLLDLWQQRQRTILFVTHNIAEAVYLSHRVAVFGKGRIANYVDNPIAWPRVFQQRNTSEFVSFYAHLSQLLGATAK
jgi:NitT/TauT family transport system ATP-binding protein